MTISRPSLEIYAVDVPEVKDLSATFRYNFFVPDESVNDTGGVPSHLLVHQADENEADFVQFATTRAPRFVVFNFTPPRLSDVGREVTDLDVRNNVFGHKEVETNLIGDNLDKIVTEDHFSSYDFVSVQFHDGEIDEKVHYLVSGSLEQHTLDDEADSDVSHNKAAGRLHSLLPQHVEPHFLTRALAQMEKSSGTSFFSSSDSTKGKKSSSSSTKHRNIRNQQRSSRQQTQLINKFFKRLQNFHIHTQINGKLFYDVVNRTINDPNSPYGDDLHSLHQYSKQVSQFSRQRFSLQINERDYKTMVPFIDLKIRRTAHNTERQGAQIVGYLIDKTETTRDGKRIQHPPVVVENQNVSTAIDFKVKYSSVYTYAIRTIAKFTLPAIDDDTGDVATIQVLVSSKPSNRVLVKAWEFVPPPPPADVNFTWNYEVDELLVHWTFPPNSQRDIKKFQIFRRKDIDHPFELIKMYDFDDSAVKFEDKEDPDPSLVEYVRSPLTFYVDDEFKKRSKYIYAIAALDAHGMTSNFSAQYQVWFDPFKNKLQKKLISHSGAPKPYPNLYLNNDTFVDTIRVSGPHSKRVKVYFNPEHYLLYDDNERIIKILSTKQMGGEYKVQFINIDNQQSQDLTITIDDRISAAKNKVINPRAIFGKTKKQKTKS